MKISIVLALLTALTASHSRVTLEKAVPPAPVPCKMNNGQNRPYPCEFQLVTMFILGKNNEVVGKITPTSTTVKLPKSKAVKVVSLGASESYIYNVSLDFRRINTPSFSPKPVPPLPGPKIGFYEVGTSKVDYPISPGEITIVSRVDVSPELPAPGIRPNRVGFTLQLDYSTGSGTSLITPVKYIQIKNPITFTKFPNAINLYRDRAEAWIVFSASVDMTK